MPRSMSDPDYVLLIAALRRAREARGVSQRELGHRLGVHQSFVAKYETCERRLDVIELLRVCAALAVELRQVVPDPWRTSL